MEPRQLYFRELSAYAASKEMEKHWTVETAVNLYDWAKTAIDIPASVNAAVIGELMSTTFQVLADTMWRKVLAKRLVNEKMQYK